jgi:hypothetical protein
VVRWRAPRRCRARWRSPTALGARSPPRVVAVTMVTCLSGTSAGGGRREVHCASIARLGASAGCGCQELGDVRVDKPTCAMAYARFHATPAMPHQGLLRHLRCESGCQGQGSALQSGGPTGRSCASVGWAPLAGRNRRNGARPQLVHDVRVDEAKPGCTVRYWPVVGAANVDPCAGVVTT